MCLCVCETHLAVGLRMLYLQDELSLDALGAVDALHRGVGATVLDGGPLEVDHSLKHGHHKVPVHKKVGVTI